MTFETELKQEYREVFKKKLESYLKTQHDALKERSNTYETYKRYERAYDSELRLSAFGVQDIVDAKKKMTEGVQNALQTLIRLSPDLKDKVDTALSGILSVPLEESKKTILELKPGYEDAKKVLPQPLQVSLLTIMDNGKEYVILPVEEKETVHNGLLYEMFSHVSNHFAAKHTKYVQHKLLGYTALQTNITAREFKDLLNTLNASKQFGAEVPEINYAGKEIALRGPNVKFSGEILGADISDRIEGAAEPVKAHPPTTQHYVDLHVTKSTLEHGVLTMTQPARSFLPPLKVPFKLEFPEGDSAEANVTSGGSYITGKLDKMLCKRHPELKPGSILRIEKTKDKHYKLHIQQV